MLALAIAIAIVLVQEGNFVEDWLLEMGLELTFEKGKMGRERRKNKRLPRAGAVYNFFARLVQGCTLEEKH